MKTVQENLNHLTDWSKKKKTYTNMVNYVTEIKSQTYFILILIGLPFCYEDINYSTSSGTKIEPMSYARDLGVQISSDYTWDHHKGEKNHPGLYEY